MSGYLVHLQIRLSISTERQHFSCFNTRTHPSPAGVDLQLDIAPIVSGSRNKSNGRSSPLSLSPILSAQPYLSLPFSGERGNVCVVCVSVRDCVSESVRLSIP
jgi:hypothetical protein